MMPGPADLAGRLERLEIESAARRVIARYFAICDDLGPHTDLAELGALFTRGATWTGRGRYREAFGRYEGREAIVAMIDAYCRPVAHFAMTGHYFSAEAITVADRQADGRWMMLQCSTYADGCSDLRSARIEVRFAFEDGVVRIAAFTTTNLFTRRVDHWTDSAAIPVPQAIEECRQ